MALIELSLPRSVAKTLRLPSKSPKRQQLRVLKKLLKKARFTEFGQAYRFDEILLSKQTGKKFQQLVPTYDYSKIYASWWHKTLEGRRDICWPGKIKFFALSSGTSEAASKYIPITNDLMRGNRIVMIKQLLSLRTYHDISVKSIGKGWLMLGGSTDLQAHLEALGDRIGDPSLVVCLDAECSDYRRVWCTTSLRGNVTGRA